ncbi:MAG: TIGR00282 family metallophosphoesterase [Acidobacteriota bacterium]
MKILFIGDLVGKPGRQLLQERLADLQSELSADFTIVNVENSAAGRGVTPALADEILAMGANVLTSGNHIWAQRGIDDYLAEEPRLLRPLNYPLETPGQGIFRGRSRDGQPVAVINLQGRVFMPSIDCPFRALDHALDELDDSCPTIVVDMHAEATSEKLAMGWYADGRVSAVLGTHTHVPTADARILPAGTAYCTDVGMSGPYDSIIGTRPDLALQRFLTARPVRFQVASCNTRLAGVVVETDPDSGHAITIRSFLDPPGSLSEADP